MPNVFRVSVTALEKFRRVQIAYSPMDTEAALEEMLRGIFVGNDLTAVGSAFHSIAEAPSKCALFKVGEQEWVRAGNICLPLAAAIKAKAYFQRYPFSVSEVPVQGMYEIEKYNILVSGRMDMLHGKLVRDLKVKFNAMYSVHEYLDSCQWKFYLDMLGIDSFYYDVFVASGFDKLGYGMHGYRYATGLNIQDPAELHCYLYDGMKKDLTLLLTQFMDYVERKGFLPILKQQEYQGEPSTFRAFL